MITLLTIVLLSQASPFGSLLQTQSSIINSHDVNSGISNFMGEMGGDKFIVPQPVQIPLKKSRYKNKRMPKMMSETACNENCICAKVTEAQGKEILEIINRSK